MIYLVKGDTISLGYVIKESITNWKIRCEIYDNNGHNIKVATANSGGTGSGTVGHIIVLDEATGKFSIYVPPYHTTDFDTISHMEIEMETDTGDIYTLLQDQITFNEQKIDWETP